MVTDTDDTMHNNCSNSLHILNRCWVCACVRRTMSCVARQACAQHHDAIGFQLHAIEQKALVPYRTSNCMRTDKGNGFEAGAVHMLGSKQLVLRMLQAWTVLAELQVLLTLA